jgi:hypothetical protein
MTLKEHSIREYISRIDFKRDDWKLSTIKEEMRRFLGEEPGIDVIYKKDVLINEDTMKAEEFVDVDRIEIVFYDTDERFKKLEFKIDTRL